MPHRAPGRDHRGLESLGRGAGPPAGARSLRLLHSRDRHSPAAAGSRRHRVHRGRHPQRRALTAAARRPRSTPSSTAGSSGTRSRVARRASLHEINVIGTLQLLAACERTETLRTVIVRGSAAIYGCEGAGPLFFTEDLARAAPLRTRFQRDISELEEYFENFARRHPELTCCMLRFQPEIGAGLDAPAGPLPHPSGGPGAARLRSTPPAAGRRGRHRGDRRGRLEPGPRARERRARRVHLAQQGTAATAPLGRPRARRRSTGR